MVYTPPDHLSVTFYYTPIVTMLCINLAWLYILRVARRGVYFSSEMFMAEISKLALIQILGIIAN